MRQPPLASFVAPLFAGLWIASGAIAQESFVTGFEVESGSAFEALPTLDPMDFPPGVPETAELRPIPMDGLEVPFAGNTITLSGGIVATVGLPDFYADGRYEWAFPAELRFDRAVLDARFSFWAIAGGINGGPDTGVSLQLLDGMGDPIGDPVYPNPLSLDGERIPEGEFAMVSDPGGFYGIRFDFDPSLLGEGEGFGIDAVSATTVPEPSSFALLALGLGGLLMRRSRGERFKGEF